MVDTILRGSGLTGAVVSTLKNVIKRRRVKVGLETMWSIFEILSAKQKTKSIMKKVIDCIPT